MSRGFESHATSLRMTVRMQARRLARIADSPHLHQIIKGRLWAAFLFLLLTYMLLAPLFGENHLLLALREAFLFFFGE